MSSSSVKCTSMSYCYAAQSNVHLQNHLSVTAMVISAWLVEQAVTKEEWRCVSMGCGGLWAAVTGTTEKPQWCANSLDTRTQVRFVYALHAVYILLYCYCYVYLILVVTWANRCIHVLKLFTEPAVQSHNLPSHRWMHQKCIAIWLSLTSSPSLYWSLHCFC